ncbi:MAG TPA: acyltransferase [Pirellulales bacterium]|jgi:peptidoglycan/LPS O-acetylase OafA/YrhL|nr:acyltransferase [Pirellulales bacterium]
MSHEAAEADFLPLPRAPKYGALDLWRGVACLMIVVFHAIYYSPYYRAFESGTAFVPGSGTLDHLAAILQKGLAQLWLGVPLFFVISGYCIMAAIDSQRRRSPGLGQYFRRRLRRIYPPYWFAILFCALAIIACEAGLARGLFADERPPVFMPWLLDSWQWLGNLTLTESWRAHVAGSHQGYFLGISWTLCYEEQFYAMAGLILLCSRRRIFLGAATVTLLAMLARVAAALAGWSIEGFFFDGRWLQFAVGILVYWRINYATARQSRGAHAIWIALTVAAIFTKDWLPSPTDRSTVLASCFALLLSLSHGYNAWFCTTAWLAPLRYCGRICYSMYLVHWLFAKGIAHCLYQHGFTGFWQTLLITIPLCVAASVAAATLFHFLVERHFLNGPARRATAQAARDVVPALSEPSIATT